MSLRCISIVTVLCAAALTQGTATSQLVQRSVLLIVMDDIGYDTFEDYRAKCYTDPGHSDCIVPRLHALTNGGIRFTQTWANPLCSPTRATIISGQYGFRTGVVRNTPWNDPNALDRVELHTNIDAIAERFGDDYSRGAFGKWHLDVAHRSTTVVGGRLRSNPDIDNTPIQHGFEIYSGPYGNLGLQNLNPPTRPRELDDHSKFLKDACVKSELDNQPNGPFCRSNDLQSAPPWSDSAKYWSTAVITTDAKDWIERDSVLSVRDPDKPWFAYVAYNAAHAPWKAPSGFDCPDSPCKTTEHRELTRDMDQKIHELYLAAIYEDPDVVIIVVGDNGTPPGIADPNMAEHGNKNTLYEGGVHVPLIISTAGTRGRLAADPLASPLVSDALVNTTDLFATAVDLAGAGPNPPNQPEDSVSLKPIIENPGLHLRSFAYAEVGDDAAIRSRSHKLILFPGKIEALRVELYRHGSQQWEENDLLPLGPDSPDREGLRALCQDLAGLASWDQDDAVTTEAEDGPDGFADLCCNAHVDVVDTDGDGIVDVCDPCPEQFTDAGQIYSDLDGDGVAESCDICPGVYNPDPDVALDEEGNPCFSLF